MKINKLIKIWEVDVFANSYFIEFNTNLIQSSGDIMLFYTFNLKEKILFSFRIIKYLIFTARVSGTAKKQIQFIIAGIYRFRFIYLVNTNWH